MLIRTRPAFLVLRDDRPHRIFVNHKYALVQLDNLRASQLKYDWDLLRIPLDELAREKGERWMQAEKTEGTPVIVNRSVFRGESDGENS